MHPQHLRPAAVIRCDRLRIPVQSIFSEDGQTFCYVMTDRGLEQRPVTLGAAGDQYAEVIHGLDEGESIVLDAAMVDSGMASEDN